MAGEMEDLGAVITAQQFSSIKTHSTEVLILNCIDFLSNWRFLCDGGTIGELLIDRWSICRRRFYLSCSLGYEKFSVIWVLLFGFQSFRWTTFIYLEERKIWDNTIITFIYKHRTAAVICSKKKKPLVSLHWTLLQWTAGFGRPRLSSALASGRPGQVISSTYHCVIAQREMYRSHVTDTRYKIFDMTLFALHGNCRLCGFRCNFYGKQLKKNQENSFFFPIQIPISFCGKKSTFKTLGKWQNIKLLKIYCTVILELVPITHAATPEQGFRSVSSSLSYVCNLTNNLSC